MNFAVVAHKDENSGFGVTVPDLPGCFSAGETMDGALGNTREAILCHIEGLLVDGEKMPAPLPIDTHQKNKDFADGIWAVVSVDLSQLSGKAKRINIKIPTRILSQIDEFANKEGETISALLVTAAMEYMSGKGV